MIDMGQWGTESLGLGIQANQHYSYKQAYFHHFCSYSFQVRFIRMHILYRKALHARHKLLPRVISLVCDNFEPSHLNNNLVANIQNTRKLCIESPDLWLLLEQIRKGGHSKSLIPTVTLCTPSPWVVAVPSSLGPEPCPVWLSLSWPCSASEPLTSSLWYWLTLLVLVSIRPSCAVKDS